MSNSKKKRYKDHAARREPGGYVPMPHVVLRSPEFAALSSRAIKLLCDLLAQYKGDNNGDLCAAMTLMRDRAWRGAATLSRAVAELRDAGFLVTTRQGGRHKASLYGVSFFSIDWCNGKLDIQAPTRAHMGSWKRVDGPSCGPLAVQTMVDCSTRGAVRPSIKLISPPVEQSGLIPAPDWSTYGHLSRDPTPRSAFAESC
jgi:hypothetical protein